MSNKIKLYKVLSDILKLDIESINDNSSADEIESWDSQAIISLVFELEQTFNVEFDILEIADIRTVRVIKKILQDKGVAF